MIWILLASQISFADVPPLNVGISPTLPSCPDVVRNYLSSSEYSDDEENDKIAAACVNADVKCVREMGETLDSGERAEAAKFLPLVKACRGIGKGDCLQDVLQRTRAYERNTAALAGNLIKKCE